MSSVQVRPGSHRNRSRSRSRSRNRSQKGPDHIRGHFPKRVIQIDTCMEGNPIQGCQDYQFIRVLKGIETDQIQDLDQDHCH